MASMLTQSVVDRGFEPQLGQTKDSAIGIFYFVTGNGNFLQTGEIYDLMQWMFKELSNIVRR